MRQRIVNHVTDLSLRARLFLPALTLMLFLLLLWLAGMLSAPAPTGRPFDWQADRPPALMMADSRRYAADWQKLRNKPYETMGDFLADRIEANRESAYEFSTENGAGASGWQAGLLDGGLTGSDGRPLTASPDNVVRRWSKNHLCPLKGWGKHTEQVRALVVGGLGECSAMARFAARSPLISAFGPTWGGLILGLVLIATMLTGYLACWVGFNRKIYNSLYLSRVFRPT